MFFVNIGFGNIIQADRIVAMITPVSAPGEAHGAEGKRGGDIVDATQGRKTKAVIITDGPLVLSALLPETIANRTRGATEREEIGNEA